MGRSRNEAQAIARQKVAQRYQKSIQKKLFRVLRNQQQEAVNRIKSNMLPIPPDLYRWGLDLYDAQIEDGQKAAYAGWQLAEEQAGLKTKGLINPELDSYDFIIGIGLEENFLLTPTITNVDNYFAVTSGKEAATHAKKITTIFERVQKEIVDEAGTARGLSSSKLASMLQKELTYTKSYSTLIARTGSIWSLNEGAEQRYISAQVESKQWWATYDELTCPYCAEMHGKIVATQTNFIDPGGFVIGNTETKVDDDGNVIFPEPGKGKEIKLDIPDYMAISHPPLHPHCRCTILPVITDIEG